ncbi:MAG: RNA polymerase sigma factor [Bacteroidales bacterium]|jgi:RNA polymerase sigma-70 factor (ECF subfamily)|nr:RNA polymerase sigma factor [Bacteroidales bacterium]
MHLDLYKTLKDEEIISMITVEKKSELFQILYDKYHSRVNDKCYSLLKNKELARETSLDIFTKVYENLDSFKGRSSFSSWLYSITYNYCIDYLRNKKKLHYPEWNRENEIPEIIDESEELSSDISYDRLMEILDLLHTEEKALLLMKYNDNISIKNIAEALRVSESAAKMRIKRAKARLVFLYKQKFKA